MEFLYNHRELIIESHKKLILIFNNKYSTYFTSGKTHASLISCLQNGNDIKVLVVCVCVKIIGDNISKALTTVFGRKF